MLCAAGWPECALLAPGCSGGLLPRHLLPPARDGCEPRPGSHNCRGGSWHTHSAQQAWELQHLSHGPQIRAHSVQCMGRERCDPAAQGSASRTGAMGAPWDRVGQGWDRVGQGLRLSLSPPWLQGRQEQGTQAGCAALQGPAVLSARVCSATLPHTERHHAG